MDTVQLMSQHPRHHSSKHNFLATGLAQRFAVRSSDYRHHSQLMALPTRTNFLATGLKLLPYTSIPSDRECSICLREPNAFGTVQLPCGHLNCKSCILEWLENHNTCPLCRAEVFMTAEAEQAARAAEEAAAAAERERIEREEAPRREREQLAAALAGMNNVGMVRIGKKGKGRRR